MVPSVIPRRVKAFYAVFNGEGFELASLLAYASGIFNRLLYTPSSVSNVPHSASPRWVKVSGQSTQPPQPKSHIRVRACRSGEEWPVGVESHPDTLQ